VKQDRETGQPGAAPEGESKSRMVIVLVIGFAPSVVPVRGIGCSVFLSSITQCVLELRTGVHPLSAPVWDHCVAAEVQSIVAVGFRGFA
jgi:hypothetical protein